MKRTVAAISFILIFIMIISASVITAGAEGESVTYVAPKNIKINGQYDDLEWRGYAAIHPFGQPNLADDEKINSGNDVNWLTVQIARVDKNTAKFNISAQLEDSGEDIANIGVKFSVERSRYAQITIADGQKTKVTMVNDDKCERTGAITYDEPSGSMVCEIEAVLKSGEFGERIECSFRIIDGNGIESTEGVISPPSITTTTEKTTKEKTTKEKTTKTTTEKATTSKPEKTSTTKATTTVTTEISHRTRRTTTAKPTTEKETEKTAKAKTTKAAEVKTTKAKTTKAKKASTKAERLTTERYYSAEAAESTTVITSAEITSEQTSVSTATQTEKSLFGGEKLSKSSLYKLITGAVALLLFAIIGVSAVRTKSAADKAEEKPFSEKEKEEEKEDKKE